MNQLVLRVERYLLKNQTKQSFLERKMNPGDMIISLDYLIKQDAISLGLPATRWAGLYEEGAWHGISALKYLPGDEKSFMHKKLDLERGALVHFSVMGVGHSSSVPQKLVTS